MKQPDWSDDIEDYGDNLCPDCKGSGKIDNDEDCENCAGTGRVEGVDDFWDIPFP